MALNSGIRKHSNKAPKLEGKTIEIKVGKPATSFHVHKSLISGSSSFFRAAMNGNWKESDCIVCLPEEIPEIFRIYVEWLYLHSIFSEKEGDVHEEGDIEYDREWKRLLKLYVCGEHLQDHAFCNAVVDAICEKAEVKGGYPGDLGIMAYAKAAASSSLCRLLVDMFVWLGDASWIRDDSRDMDGRREFYDDVLRKMFEIRNARSSIEKPYPWVMDRCRYHEHPDGQQKCGSRD